MYSELFLNLFIFRISNRVYFLLGIVFYPAIKTRNDITHERYKKGVYFLNILSIRKHQHDGNGNAIPFIRIYNRD